MNNLDIIKVVAEDLRYLMDVWDQEVSALHKGLQVLYCDD
jgi:hypothetical protein